MMQKRRPPMSKKPKNFKKTMMSLIKYLKGYVVYIVLAVVFAIVATIFRVIGPDKLSDMMAEITKGLGSTINMAAVWKIANLLFGLFFASVILQYAQNYIMAKVSAKVTKEMRAEISKKINVLPLKYFDSTSSGDILSIVTNDVDTISQSLNQTIGQLVTAITMFLGSIVMMFITNWIMALTAIGASIIGFVFMIFTTSKSQKYFRQQQQSLGDVNGHIEEIYTNHNVVKAYNGGRAAKETFEKHNEKLRLNGWKAQFISGLMMPMMGFVGNLGYVAVCVVGAVLTMEGRIGFEVIVAFMIYVRLFTQPLSQMAQGIQGLQSTAAASERVFDFLNQEELSDESQKRITLENIKGHVEFKNVKFGYNEDKLVIKNFSAEIEPGQKVAIVGPTGAGKTTIVNLLMRFYELNSGEILIDGTSIANVTRENVHDQFGMVLQDAWIFHGTITENIVYSKEDVSLEEVIKACKLVGIHHFITTLPEGYNTVLDDKTSFSEGQKQLLTIARAMVQNSPLLILDEATSSVDTRTEVLIQKAMDELTKGRTSFVIAHRLSTIKNADLILVMKDGDIIEKGKHEELLNNKGFYEQLYNSQFETI